MSAELEVLVARCSRFFDVQLRQAEEHLAALRQEHEAIMRAISGAIGLPTDGPAPPNGASAPIKARGHSLPPARGLTSGRLAGVETIDVKELARLVNRAVSTVKKDLTRRPDTLPPPMLVPGCRVLLWRVDDVREWMQACADLAQQERQAKEEAARRARVTTDFSYKPLLPIGRAPGRDSRPGRRKQVD